MFLSIQYIRALAAMMVVIVHTYGGFGAQGVDIFFVLSGFIMMHIMYTSHRGALEFFLARLFRVAPIYYIFTLIALYIGNSNDPTIEHIIHSFLFLKIKWSSPVLSIGWTLEYEFVFYCICAISLLFPLSKKARVFLVVSGLILLSILLDAVLYPDKAYGHFIEFIFGIICYFAVDKLSVKKFSFINKRLLYTFSFLSLLLLFLIQNNVYTEGKLPFWFLGYGLASFTFCLSFILLEPHLPKFKYLLLLGNASYAIYITHTTTLFLYYKTFNVTRYQSVFSDTVSIVAVLIVGILSHIFIEKLIAKKLSSKETSEYLLSSFPLANLPTKCLKRTH